MLKYDVVVVGSGPAGCISAERLANKKDAKVLIVEKRPHIGGNLHDSYNSDGILIHNYGPHFFRTDKENIWEYLCKFTDWHYYEHKVVASVKGMIVPFPINLDTYNQLFNANLDQVGFRKFLDSCKFTDEPKNAEEAVVNQVGQDLYEAFFKNYTLKQWGRHPRELHADTVKRVPVRVDRENRYQLAKYQGVPRPGYAALMQKMIDHPNIHLMLNVDYKDVIDHVEWKHLVYTGPVDEFYGYKFGKLNYRSLRFEEKNHAVESYQDHAVINYPNNYGFTRITEYKKMTGQIHPKTTLHVEYPEEYQQGVNDPYYPILSEDNLQRKDQYMALAREESSVSFLGRLAEYRYYAMDDVVEASLNHFDNRLSKLDF